MKRIAIVIGIAALLFLTACGGVQLKKDTTNIVLDSAAATIGYIVGTNNPERISEWIRWADKLTDIEAGFAVSGWKELLAEGFNLAGDPFLELQIKNFIQLLTFPDIQPPDNQFLKTEYIERARIVIFGFKDALIAASSNK